MKLFIRRSIEPVYQSKWYADLILAVPRFVGGMLLAIDFGASKFGMPWTPADKELGLFEVSAWFPEDVAQFGGVFALAPTFFAWMAAASESIGGLTLAAGLQTRLSSALIMCTMLVAIFFQKWGQGTWGMLPAMGFLWLSTYNLVLGSGRFGIDHLISRNWMSKR